MILTLLLINELSQDIYQNQNINVVYYRIRNAEKIKHVLLPSHNLRQQKKPQNRYQDQFKLRIVYFHTIFSIGLLYAQFVWKTVVLIY